MRVIITGAAGEIGRQTVEELSDGHELCLMDRRPVVLIRFHDGPYDPETRMHATAHSLIRS
jgi:nucleoside-diphosphate-sugar epimerase